MTTDKAQEPKCGNCAHWKPSGEIKPPGSTIYGWCHRYPPNDASKWPVTSDYDECGEFKLKIEIKPVDSTPTDIPSVVARVLWDMGRRDFMAGRAPIMVLEAVHYTMGYNSVVNGETEPGLANSPQPGE